MYSTFFGECSSLKKRSYLSQWDFNNLGKYLLLAVKKSQRFISFRIIALHIYYHALLLLS